MAAVAVPLLVLCVLGARVWQGRPVAAVLLAVVAGSSLAVLAVLTKGVVDTLGNGFGAVLRMPSCMRDCPLRWSGMIFQQSAFRAGALTASMPTVTVVEPVVASALGVMVLNETLDAHGPRILALAGAAVMVIFATWALARGKAATMAAGTGQDARRADESPVRSQRRLVQSKADEDVGHAQQQIQRCHDQARDDQAVNDAPPTALESRVPLLAFEFRRAQCEPDIEQLV